MQSHHEASEVSNYSSIKSDAMKNFTLVFTNTHGLKYPGIAKYFGQYSNFQPDVSKGPTDERVLVSFKNEMEAMLALRKNIENGNYPMLSFIHACRS